jgi:hypothetical protein
MCPHLPIGKAKIQHWDLVPIIFHVNDMVSSQQGQHMLVVECIMGPQLVLPKMCWLCIEPPQKNGLNTYDMVCSMFSCTKLCSHAKFKRIFKRCSYFAMARNILHRLFLFICLLQHVPIKQNDYHHWSQHGFLIIPHFTNLSYDVQQFSRPPI